MMVILTGKHSGDKDVQISGMIHRVFLFDQLTFTDRYGGLEGRSPSSGAGKSIGNVEAKELICMIRGHELTGGM